MVGLETRKEISESHAFRDCECIFTRSMIYFKVALVETCKQVLRGLYIFPWYNPLLDWATVPEKCYQLYSSRT